MPGQYTAFKTHRSHRKYKSRPSRIKKKANVDDLICNKPQKTASDPGLLALVVVAGLQGQCRSDARSSIKKC